MEEALFLFAAIVLTKLQRREGLSMGLFHKEITYPSPLPPLAGTDCDAVTKFLSAAESKSIEVHEPLDPYYDWVIHTLLSSMMVDSASRIFLPKTETSQFQLDDLFPFSYVRPTGTAPVKLANLFVIAPLWNNADSLQSIQAHEALPHTSVGVYIEELNLAIITDSVHQVYFSRYLRRGEVVLYKYELAEMAKTVQTDGTSWLVTNDKGEQETFPALEPRMAVLYSVALRRHGLEKDQTPTEDRH